MTNYDQGKNNTGAQAVKMLAGRLPRAQAEEMALGWTLDVDFLQTLTKEPEFGYDISLEAAEHVALTVEARILAALNADAIAALVGAAQMMVRAYRKENDRTIHAFYALEAALARLGGME